MKKAELIVAMILVILLMLCPFALAEQTADLGNGFWITVPDTWVRNEYQWMKDNSIVFSANTIDMTDDFARVGINPAEGNQQFILNYLASELGIEIEESRKVDTQNEWTAMMYRTTQDGIPLEIVLVLKDNTLCIINYGDMSQSSGDIAQGAMEVVQWLTDQAPAQAETVTQEERIETVSEEEGIEKIDGGYLLHKGPMTVALDEADYNIAYLGMPEDTLSVQRSGYRFSDIDRLLQYGEKTDMIIWRIGEDGLSDQAPCVRIRIKYKKYDGYDFRRMSQSILKEILDGMVIPMSKDGSYTVETINGIPYAAFPFYIGNQMRYATMLNGSMVYIYMSSDNELTAEDELLLQTVLESITCE